ncbi:MAG: DedA family protein [Gammaproteobacteria bacterium]|nr:DedA family protein [Gammaproteobacteria bacterium]
MDYLSSIDFSELIKQSQYTGLVIFFIAFLETLLVVGFIFPGSVALIAIGGLIATGHLELWTTLFWAFLGAVVGDNLSFWIGVYFKEPLKRSKIYHRHKNEFKRGEEFFHQYGVYSVAIGRFIGPIRAVIPAIAGSLGMSGRLFLIVNIFSAAVWAPVYILPGLFVGDFFSYIKQYMQIEMSTFALIIVGLVVFLFLLKKTKK